MKEEIFPTEHAGMLDNSIRRLFHNPRKILSLYVNKEMTALDLGCGPGFFSIEMAKLAGKVVAADLQDGMLEKEKAKKAGIEIELHKCKTDKIGLPRKFDFILMFYMLHETPDQHKILEEVKSLLKPEGKLLIVEPKFHVPKKDFNKSVEIIKEIGFKIVEQPKIFLSRAIVVQKRKSISLRG